MESDTQENITLGEPAAEEPIRPGPEEPKKAFNYEEVEPAENPVDLTSLLDEIESTIRKHVVLPPEAAKALAVWVVHTYVFKTRDAVAYVAIQSPEKRCGKTTLLSVIAGMACKPLVASNITVGALFRAIDEAGPTLLIDEADTFLGRNSAMRGILNSGNTRRTAYVLRLARQSEREQTNQERQQGIKPSNVVRYSCWCPKVIAMIGKVPETLGDRSIIVNMERKLIAEKCAPLAEFDPAQIRRQCQRWANDHEQQVAQWPRQVLQNVSDRASDTYEPLLVIAQLAGQRWHGEIVEAATKLCSYENTEPEAASLLLDIMAVFIFRQTQRLFTRDLVVSLKGKSGWMAYDVTSRYQVSELSIAKVLRNYGIRPTTVRMGPDVSRGYKWEQFREALEHYVPKKEVQSKLAELKEMNALALEAKLEKEKLEAEEAAKFQEEEAELLGEKPFGEGDPKKEMERLLALIREGEPVQKPQEQTTNEGEK